MSNKFSSYVQSTAFSLSLSRNMIDALYWCKRYGFATPSIVCRLESRGLVHQVERQNWKGVSYMSWELTEAGELLLPLLKLAGLEKDLGEPPEPIPPAPLGLKTKISIDKLKETP